jgi:hypothetical protein
MTHLPHHCWGGRPAAPGTGRCLGNARWLHIFSSRVLPRGWSRTGDAPRVSARTLQSALEVAVVATDLIAIENKMIIFQLAASVAVVTERIKSDG